MLLETWASVTQDYSSKRRVMERYKQKAGRQIICIFESLLEEMYLFQGVGDRSCHGIASGYHKLSENRCLSHD